MFWFFCSTSKRQPCSVNKTTSMIHLPPGWQLVWWEERVESLVLLPIWWTQYFLDQPFFSGMMALARSEIENTITYQIIMTQKCSHRNKVPNFTIIYWSFKTFFLPQNWSQNQIHLTRDSVVALFEVRTAETTPGLTLFRVLKGLANWLMTQGLLFKLPLILSPKKPFSWRKKSPFSEFAKWVLALKVTQADAIAVTSLLTPTQMEMMDQFYKVVAKS